MYNEKICGFKMSGCDRTDCAIWNDKYDLCSMVVLTESITRLADKFASWESLSTPEDEPSKIKGVNV
jgi:hypothetical protein